MTKLGDLIKKKRQSQGLSLREFADKCGLSHSYIKNLEEFDPRSGKTVVPTIDSMEKLAGALDMTLEELLRETGYIQSAGLKFEPSNLKLIRGAMTYEEIAEDIMKKTGSRLEPSVLKTIEEGQDKNHTPIFAEILAKYAGVDRSFFYRKNTRETLELARQREPYQQQSSTREEQFSHITDSSVRAFLNDPDTIEYIKLAKDLYERKIKVTLVRNTLFNE